MKSLPPPPRSPLTPVTLRPWLPAKITPFGGLTHQIRLCCEEESPEEEERAKQNNTLNKCVALAKANTSSCKSASRLQPNVNFCFSSCFFTHLRPARSLRSPFSFFFSVGGQPSHGKRLLMRVALRTHTAQNRFGAFLPLRDATSLPAIMEQIQLSLSIG